MFEIPQLAFVDNPIIWVIVALALLCYVQQFNLLLSERDAKWRQQTGIWLKVLPVLLSALPLLGLLGTIVGLMSTFRSMGQVGVLTSQNFLSSGIADALITTQLGLVSVIPGLVLLAVLRQRHRTLSL
jgi:biopolymer transport protein ExbB